MTDDPYSSIADLYEFAYNDFTEDIDFYSNLAEAGDGSILELGVGTGRVAIPLASEGFRVTGIDLSEAMLAVAQRRLASQPAKHGSLSLLKADMTDFALEPRFDLAFIAANTFQH